MTRRILIIVNPMSGRGRARQLLPALAGALQQRGYTTEIFQTSGPGEAREAAANAAPDATSLLSVGGDGTLNEVVSGNLARKLPVAVLPLGTANLLARELGLPWHVPALAEALVAPEPRWIDLMQVTHIDRPEEAPRIALAVASAGIDADVVEDFAARRRGAIHFLDYAWPLARQLVRYAPEPLEVEVDGRTVAGPGDDVTCAIIANARFYGGPFAIAPDADPSDGQLDVRTLRVAGLGSILRLGPRLLASVLREGVDVGVARGTSITLRAASGRATALQIDGDPGGALPTAIELLPRAMPFLGCSSR